MKCIKLTYRKSKGGTGYKVIRVSDRVARERVGNPNRETKAEYASKEEWKKGGRLYG